MTKTPPHTPLGSFDKAGVAHPNPAIHSLFSKFYLLLSYTHLMYSYYTIVDVLDWYEYCYAPARISIYAPTPTIICFTDCAHLSRNREAHSCQSFTDVKLQIICYSDACLSNIYALKYALTTARRCNYMNALVHECGHSEGTPGRQRVKTINILPPKTIERNEQKQVRAYPYE